MLDSPALYARGPYRVVANAPQAPGRLYAVVDTAGAWLHEEVSLDAARVWIDRRIAELDEPRDGPSASVSPHRIVSR